MPDEERPHRTVDDRVVEILMAHGLDRDAVQVALGRHHHQPTKEKVITMTTMPAIGHVAVTVTDLAVSAPWYTRVFGADPVLDEDTGPFRHVVYALGGTLFGLHQFPDLTTTEKFQPRRPGLDHIAFGCESRADLEKWASRLDEMGIEHGEIVDAGYGSGLAFKDPDGIALELFAPPS